VGEYQKKFIPKVAWSAFSWPPTPLLFPQSQGVGDYQKVSGRVLFPLDITGEYTKLDITPSTVKGTRTPLLPRLLGGEGETNTLYGGWVGYPLGCNTPTGRGWKN